MSRFCCYLLIILAALGLSVTTVEASILDYHMGQQSVSLTVDDLGEAVSLIRALPLLETSAQLHLQRGDGYIEGFVASSELNHVLAQLEQWGTVTASQLSQQNVFGRIQDLRTELDVRGQELDRLMELHAEATTIPVLMRVDQSMQSVITHMEHLQAQLTQLETDTATTLLTVNLRATPLEIDPLVLDPDEDSFTQRVGHTFSRSAGLTGTIVTEVILFVSRWAVPVGLVVAVVWVVRKVYHKVDEKLSAKRREAIEKAERNQD